MPQTASIENNFSAGLKTDFTALNFPPHAATDADNVIFSRLGDVYRRSGFDFETNYTTKTVNRTGKAMSSYIWKNAGGDGNTLVYVQQIGNILYFYKASVATVASPLSNRILVSTVDISTYIPLGSSADPSISECMFTDGNGYLFVFHPNTESLYCTYSADTVTVSSIVINTRDFKGIPDGLSVNNRPSTLSAEHQYNLTNQGWTAGNTWSSSISSDWYPQTIGIGGVIALGIANSGLSISVGDKIRNYYLAFGGGAINVTGLVTNYTGSTLTFTILGIDDSSTTHIIPAGSSLFPISVGYINTWHTATGGYPSNADVWWRFKDSTDTFSPSTTLGNVTLGTTPAPKGHYILNEFNKDFITASGVADLTSLTTYQRPKSGCWFQGRVWYTGVDANQAATGDQPFFTWTENIYFSQIVVGTDDFGKCYQTNDPTSEDLFTLLPSDGGVITIQGCGSIYKLFPIQNGMLVFAANGIWFITGSQGIGFTANDYTITKISDIQVLSSNSFIQVNGLPIFWNSEAIYTIQPAQQGLGLTVDPISTGTISKFYEDIPKLSKQYARGSYDPINYIVQWCYRSTVETSVTDRYQYDSIMCFNIYTKAFYTYTLDTGANGPYIHDIKYVDNPGGDDQYPPQFKYFCSYYNGSTYLLTFAEEKDDTHYKDWYSFNSSGYNYSSYFITGYSLKGGAYQQFQPIYVYMFSNSDVAFAYKISGIWDFASSPSALGRTSIVQTIYNNLSRFGIVNRKHKIRGHGMSLQIKVESVDGLPFDIIGWTVPENVESGVA